MTGTMDLRQMDLHQMDLNQARHLLSARPLPKAPSASMPNSACVLMPLFEKDDEAHLLAILKTDTKGYPWRNQVALPGGHIDRNDQTALAAAYREIDEELGIRASELEPIGSLGHFLTIRQTEIEAFVAFFNGDRARLRFDPLEISQIIDIPLRTLIATHVAKRYENRIPDIAELIYPFGNQTVVIWGVTARIIHFFLEHLRQLAPEHFRSPKR